MIKQNMPNRHSLSLVMFDLDGTLVDSVPDLAFAIDDMLIHLGEEPVGSEHVRLWVGNGAQMLVKRALSRAMLPKEIDLTLLDKAMTLFFDSYQKVNGSKSQLYPYVRETLIYLRQRVPYLALVTNKPEQFTQALLDAHHLPKFDLVVCGDTLAKRKPAPDQLLHCLGTFRCEPAESIMVGDSSSDIKAAKQAGVPILCVRYGYNQGEDLRFYQPDRMIDSFDQLRTIILEN
ncbi:MAG: phosphoglycolate phosphatase [Oleiphilus sp.]